MKRTLTLLLVLAFAGGCSAFAAPPAAVNAKPQTSVNVKPQPVQNFNRPSREDMKKQFEQRLNLTEKQKEKAKKINEKGREKMQPLFREIGLKHQELKKVRTSELTEEEKNKKIEQLRVEIRELDKKARDLRKKNSEEFEKILTKEQKAELEKMKTEGRQRFEKTHPARPPFQGIGNPVIKPGFKHPKVSE